MSARQVQKGEVQKGEAEPMSPKWTAVRLVLGLLQMTGSIAAFSLLIQTGVSEAAIWAAVITAVVSVLSIILFKTSFGARLRG